MPLPQTLAPRCNECHEGTVTIDGYSRIIVLRFSRTRIAFLLAADVRIGEAGSGGADPLSPNLVEGSYRSGD